MNDAMELLSSVLAVEMSTNNKLYLTYYIQ